MVRITMHAHSSARADTRTGSVFAYVMFQHAFTACCVCVCVSICCMYRYTSPQLSILLGGILPFAAVFIEIFFIMSSVWLNQFYYVFGFLFIVFVILLITCAEITIVLCYFQLCNEDYHWWWRSYLTPGSSALYLFLYSILYFFTKLQVHIIHQHRHHHTYPPTHIHTQHSVSMSRTHVFLHSVLWWCGCVQIVKFTSGLLFFGYMFLVCAAFFVLTGTHNHTTYTRTHTRTHMHTQHTQSSSHIHTYSHSYNLCDSENRMHWLIMEYVYG